MRSPWALGSPEPCRTPLSSLPTWRLQATVETMFLPKVPQGSMCLCLVAEAYPRPQAPNLSMPGPGLGVCAFPPQRGIRPPL